MIVGIDAITIKSDGGVEHLTQILNKLSNHSDIEKIFVWSNSENLKRINNKKVIKCTNKLINLSKITNFLWRLFVFGYELRKKNCDILLCCSGYFISFSSCKKVLIFQNILPFVQNNFKNKILKILYKFSLNKANGIIFLSKNSESIISKNIKKSIISKVIYHGVDEKYFNTENQTKKLLQDKIKLIYVSTICSYKNQINLIKALFILIKKGFNIQLDLVGNINLDFKKEFYTKLNKLGLDKKVNLLGQLQKDELVKVLKKDYIKIFPSKFETFGISLLESMASSKLILCSKTSAMPEILNDAGLYFDPLVPESIADCIENTIKNNTNHMDLKTKAYKRAKNYSWEKCSKETFNFIKFIYEKHFNN